MSSAPAAGSPSDEPAAGADAPKLGPRVEIDGHAVLCGTCSWTDKTLVRETDWYPRRTMSAEERLQFYAAHFPLTEIDSTYYAPPARAAVAAVGAAHARRLPLRHQGLLAAHRAPDQAPEPVEGPARGAV